MDKLTISLVVCEIGWHFDVYVLKMVVHQHFSFLPPVVLVQSSVSILQFGAVMICNNYRWFCFSLGSWLHTSFCPPCFLPFCIFLPRVGVLCTLLHNIPVRNPGNWILPRGTERREFMCHWVHEVLLFCSLDLLTSFVVWDWCLWV